MCVRSCSYRLNGMVLHAGSTIPAGIEGFRKVAATFPSDFGNVAGESRGKLSEMSAF